MVENEISAQTAHYLTELISFNGIIVHLYSFVFVLCFEYIQATSDIHDRSRRFTLFFVH
jgi:hypothetical protein